MHASVVRSTYSCRRFYHDIVAITTQRQAESEASVHLRQLLNLLKTHSKLQTECGDTDLLWFLVKAWNLGVHLHAKRSGNAKTMCALAMQYLQLLSPDCQELLSSRMTRDFGLISVSH
eukprot:TRINITY_DN10184_c0_g1_i1.p2 TRINITY_DN10184_c0_g1~~TRINITY_DN10184_c0_g1_i1.p2  ORF type:complete len:118 (+),score=20.63 TRINITY_DN10184_c0_g1_i1:1763-2116(+)